MLSLALEAFEKITDDVVILDAYTADLLGEHVDYLPVQHVTFISRFGNIVSTSKDHGNGSYLVIAREGNTEEEIKKAYDLTVPHK
ncbi:hypothetical protein FOCC_FOCC008242 [Frankliniella occidentalis]|nr:hypothetical protein FOCC_FOCC008242 [Frankliniella occidentalis]